ncbi:MAG: methyltransferase domain-containing protein [Acidobacteria bacterium]|nr:methyltransferase domain-containing protein [Acidobacteriota bacterium]MBV9071530.1 methyltransferase domain-containing protein [Acidobacteriota bacterium]MBV9187023.1 methyltransferase domain-containing protein [Acidobacteriota bacterium]
MSEDRFVDAPPSGADGWRDVWQNDRRFRPRKSAFGYLLRLFQRILDRATRAERDRQRDFNLALLDLVSDLRSDIGRIRDDLKRDIETVQRDVRVADEALAEELRKIRELIPIAAKRNDSLIAALDQKIETVAVRVRDVTNPVLASAAAADFLYRRLEDGLRGEVDVADYVAMAKEPVIDVGCGRGEFLIACRTAAIAARGFDTNERSVADLVARGIDATVAGVPGCFADIANASIGTVVAMHVVEHLPVDALFALFAESARVLRPGGLLIIETPNAESLAVSASEFWRDPTHLAPRHPAALTLLAREYGFAIDELRAIHPFPDANRFVATSEDLRALVDALNERVFGGQDLRLVLRR